MSRTKALQEVTLFPAVSALSEMYCNTEMQLLNGTIGFICLQKTAFLLVHYIEQTFRLLKYTCYIIYILWKQSLKNIYKCHLEYKMTSLKGLYILRHLIYVNGPGVF